MARHSLHASLAFALLLAGAEMRAQTPLTPRPGSSSGTVPSPLSNLTRPGGTGVFNKSFNAGINQRFTKSSPLQDSRFGMKNYERTYSELMDKRADTWKKIYDNGTTAPWTTAGNPYATGELRTPETNGWTGMIADFRNADARKERTAAARFDEAPIFNLMDKKNFAGPAAEALDRTSFNSIRRREYNVAPVEKRSGLEVFGGQGGLTTPAGSASGNGFFDDGASGSKTPPTVIQPGAQPIPSNSGERSAPAPAETVR